MASLCHRRLSRQSISESIFSHLAVISCQQQEGETHPHTSHPPLSTTFSYNSTNLNQFSNDYSPSTPLTRTELITVTPITRLFMMSSMCCTVMMNTWDLVITVSLCVPASTDNNVRDQLGENWAEWVYSVQSRCLLYTCTHLSYIRSSLGPLHTWVFWEWNMSMSEQHLSPLLITTTPLFLKESIYQELGNYDVLKFINIYMNLLLMILMTCF